MLSVYPEDSGNPFYHFGDGFFFIILWPWLFTYIINAWLLYWTRYWYAKHSRFFAIPAERSMAYIYPDAPRVSVITAFHNS